MKKQARPIVAMVAVFGLGFLVAVAMRPRPVVEVHTGPSAAMTIVLFLLTILGIMVVLAVVVVLVWQVLRAREQTKRMEQAALLFGAKNTPKPARPAVRGTEGGTVIMIGGGGQPRVEDMRQ